MREKLDGYEFEVRKHYANKPMWDYLVYWDGVAMIESLDWFMTENEARFACIGEITLLKNGGSYHVKEN
jgi:hypothetical protein